MLGFISPKYQHEDISIARQFKDYPARWYWIWYASSRFIVKKGAPGLKATKIENKIGLRMVQNGDIVLDKVFVPEEERIPGINSFQDIKKVPAFAISSPCFVGWRFLFGHPLNFLKQVFAMSRVLVTWQPIGISMGVFDMCHRCEPYYYLLAPFDPRDFHYIRICVWLNA